MKKAFFLFSLFILFSLPSPAQNSSYLILDGIDAYMLVGSNTSLDVLAGEDISISCWIRTSDFGKRILCKRVGYGPGYEFINNTSPGGQFGVNLRSVTNVNAGPPYGTSNITDFAWHHLAMVISSSGHTCKIYVDGQEEQSAVNPSIGSESFSSPSNLFVGVNNALSDYLYGNIDNLRYWSYAMTASEVQGDMTAVITGNEVNLLAAWDFENVTGPFIPDISGNNHTGYLFGGAVVSAPSAMQVDTVKLIQTELPVGRGDTSQRIIAINIKTSGANSPLLFMGARIRMKGTTDIADVSGIKLMYTGSSNSFDNPALIGSALPGSGAIDIIGSQYLQEGYNYFWVAYDVAQNASEGHFLDASCDAVIITTQPCFPFPADTVIGHREILLSNTRLFTGGDYGSSNYRIPAIITAADSSLVTLTDKRLFNSGDLPNRIDLVARRSTDLGKTWSPPVTIADYGTANSAGAGDGAIVMDRNSGTLISLFAANNGFFQSTPSNPILIQCSKSYDNGISWSPPVDITNQIYGSGCANTITHSWYGAFVASGRAHQLRNGRIVAAIAVRTTSGNAISDFMIYSDDGGTTWLPSTDAATNTGDEAKIVELNDSSLMMSIRHNGNRLISVSHDQGMNWGSAYYELDLWGTACNGDFIRYTSTVDGYDKDRLLHSLPMNLNVRKNVSVLISYDEGISWPLFKTIYPGFSAYSSLTVLPDGTIGIYYECGEYQTYEMYFARFSLSWLTNGSDTYTGPAVGIKDQTGTLPAIYPNPARSRAYIKTELRDADIRIWDTTGRQIRVNSFPVHDGYKLDISTLTKGVYIVSLTDKNGIIQSMKLVID